MGVFCWPAKLQYITVIDHIDKRIEGDLVLSSLVRVAKSPCFGILGSCAAGNQN
jgi:hypothetical protein